MIVRTFYMMLICIWVTDIIIFFTHICPAFHSAWKWLWFLQTAILTLLLIYVLIGHDQNFLIEKSHVVGYYFMFGLAIIIPKIVFIAVYSINLIIRIFSDKNFNTAFTTIALILALGMMGIIIYGTTTGWKRYTIRRTDIYSAKIPKAFDGFRIIHISDIHAATWNGNEKALKRITDQINRLKPDLIAFTGDLITHKSSELKSIVNILGDIKADYGVCSVLGNHDYSPYYPWKSKKDSLNNLKYLFKIENHMKWKLLNNENMTIHKGEDSITIIGVENWGEPPFSRYGDLDKAMENTNPDQFRILLSHNPSHWRAEAIDAGIDLMLAGHTHAMQLKILGKSPSSIKYKEWGGLYSKGDQYLYVNEGMGCTLIPFRFGSWNEITAITLRRKE